MYNVRLYIIAIRKPLYPYTMLLAILSLCMIKPSDYFTQHSSMATGTRHRTGIQGQKFAWARTVCTKERNEGPALASGVSESGPWRRPRPRSGDDWTRLCSTRTADPRLRGSRSLERATRSYSHHESPRIDTRAMQLSMKGVRLCHCASTLFRLRK